MIAFARPCTEPSSTPAWHSGFLNLLPAIREQLRFLLRKLSVDERAEALAECVANVVLAYARLYERGKLDVAYASSLAAYAVKHYFSGRRVGNPLNADDVASPWAQKQRGFRVRSLDRRDAAGAWKEVVVEDGRASPAEVAASRIDLADWLDELPRLKRGIAEMLATGETTSATARQFQVTPGRVSQIRRELADNWAEFQGQSLVCA